MVNMKNFVRQYREEIGITQEMLAEEACIAQSSLSDIERGAQIPSVFAAIRIAQALEIPVKTLFVLDESKDEDNDWKSCKKHVK